MRPLLTAAVVALAAGLSAGADKEIKPQPTWKGSVADEGLQKDAPTVVTDAKALAKLWDAWKVGDKVPEVDFGKNLVVVTTSRGSVVSLNVSLSESGDLRVSGFGTRDLRPGFRYAIGVVSREGVKAVNGKELPKG